MDIVKKLNLNKTPKDVENNSIVAAKNIMLDDTASYITNEIGLSIAFECPNEGEFIVGAIPCSEETIIFTYCFIDKSSHIYRLYSNNIYKEISTTWTYSGGKIIGTYTYNYKKELIIAVAEYDAYDIYGNNLLVPLKSWNLDEPSNSINYSTEERIPKFDVNYVISNKGSLITGTYTLFIRYKISEQSYTKWIQITDDIIIINLVDKERPVHTYMDASNSTTVNTSTTNFTGLYVNDNKRSSKAIQLTFNFSSDCKFKEYQIGYIFKRNSDIVARIKSSFDIATENVLFNSNDYIEELAVDDLLREPNQFYNVKSLINYNNRLYIANYKEYRNENLQSYADTILFDVKTIVPTKSTITKEYTLHDITLNFGDGTTFGSCSVLINNVRCYEEDGNIYITNPSDFVKDNIIPNIYVKNFQTGTAHNIANDSVDLTYDSNTDSWTKHTLTWGLFIARKNTSDKFWIYSSNKPNDSYDFKIKLNYVDNTDSFYLSIIPDDSTIAEMPLNDTTCGYNISVIQKDYIMARAEDHSPSDQNIGIFINDGLGNISYLPSVDPTYTYYYFYFNNGVPPTPSPWPVPYPAITLNLIGISYDKTEILTKDDPCNNNRTLIPNQIYSIYVHYIRKDYSYTDGFKVSNIGNSGNVEIVNNSNNDILFRIKNITDDHLIVPEISNITIPESYIGCFLTYEDLEHHLNPCISIREEINQESQDFTQYKNDLSSTESVFSDASLYGNKFNNLTRNYRDKSYLSKEDHKNQLRETYSSFVLDYANDVRLGDKCQFDSNTNTLYSNSIKTLYRFTKNIYSDSLTDNTFMFLPGYYNTEKIPAYDQECIISPTANNVLGGDGNKIVYNLKLHTIENYSYNPLNAYSILQDYAQGAAALVDASAVSKGVFYNKVLSPDKLNSFLEIKQSYIAKPNKIYTNYSKTHSDTFTKTIYRSNIISDESLINGFREFEPSNYKNILENKGDIVNIVGIGLYFIVHTKYSLFVFDRTPKLTTKSQLSIPDIFDIDYQEIMPSNEGFGGLYDREESIITKHGYIWYDKINKYIFKYENGKAEIISIDIHNFIKKLNIDYVRFAEDIIYNRLLICIYLTSNYDNDYYDENNQYPVKASITISYNFNTKTFISLHDYSFTENYRTYNNSYLFDKNKDRKRLYQFDKYSTSFQNLVNKNSVYFPEYIEHIDENNTIINNEESDEPIENQGRIDSSNFYINEVN